MPTYRDFRIVLRKTGFNLVRTTKHETWEKICDDGSILRTRLSHQHGTYIPKLLFYRMLKQCGLTEVKFDEILRK